MEIKTLDLVSLIQVTRRFNIHDYVDKWLCPCYVYNIYDLTFFMIVHWFLFTLSMGMPTSKMIFDIYFSLYSFECSLQVFDHFLWSDPWNDKALQYFKLIFQTLHFRGQSITHQFFVMTLDQFMDIITIHEHVETISLISPTTQNMLKSMRNFGQIALTPC